MKLPLSWVNDYTDIKTTPHEFAEKMTMSGSKVECYYSEADEIENVVIAKVLKIEKHPDSDHLVVCQLDTGDENPVQIVTGAANLKVGDLVPAALNNSRLPGGVKIKKGKLRGVESCGMMCSLGELGLTVHDFPNAVENGILVLDEDVAPGTPAVKALGMDDTCVEFEITPNRPDCNSVKALAREAAATYKTKFNDHIPAVPSGEGDINDYLSVKIENSEKCSRYCAAVVKNVRVKPSPRWLRQRLRVCGVRPINNIVDITNYVMLEYGQPMHAFDIAYVNGGKITVRNAKENEKIVTLDNIERNLTAETLVIADEKEPIAVAGVMGGEYSGIYDNTNTIVFESACFDGPAVRTSAKRIGLRTEASSRFEKGLNPENCMPALHRALELVAMLDAGDVIGGFIDVYPAPRTERRVKLRPDAVNRLLGTQLEKQQMIDILLPLNFKMDGDDVIVPPERYDVARDCDIAEEVARFVGYNKIPSTIMRGVAASYPTERQIFDEKISNALVGYGMYECETFSFYSPKCFDMINLSEDSYLRRPIVISNPLGEDTSIMRTTALPSMLEVIARNCNARNASAALFENAVEYIPNKDEEKLPDEIKKIIAAAYGDGVDYLYMKGIAEKLLQTAGITEYTVCRNTSGGTWHPGRTADIMVGDIKVATVGEIHPQVLANYKIKPRVVAADINADNLFACRGAVAQFKPLPKFPAITRDLALVAEENVSNAEIVNAIKGSAGKVLEKVELFDIYRGENIGEGKKSMAYSLTMRAEESSLTDEDADAAVKRILKALEAVNVTLRA